VNVFYVSPAHSEIVLIYKELKANSEGTVTQCHSCENWHQLWFVFRVVLLSW